MKSSGAQSAVITPRAIRVVALAVMWIGIGGYFGWQLYNLFQPPFLVVTNPSRDIITEDQAIEFFGNTQRESDISINGTDVEVKTNGTFHERLTLQQGMNIFEVRSVNKFGKETTLIRRIIKQ